MIKIIDFVDVCSISLLSTYDQIDRKYDSQNRLYLELNKDNKELLRFHILSNLQINHLIFK